MKTLKIILQILKWIIITGIVLFSLALFLNKSYLQFLIFLVIAATLAWWPKFISRKWNKKAASISRFGFLIFLVLVKVVFLKGEPKAAIYTSPENQEKLMTIYNEKVSAWPENTEDIFIDTEYGKVHVLACGSK